MIPSAVAHTYALGAALAELEMIILLKTLPTDLDITRVRSRPERSRRRCTTLAPRHGTRIRADERDHLNPSPLTPGGEPISASGQPQD